jgi:uroporphyrinogen-III synthase
MIGVLNTRPRDQAPALNEGLRAAGFEPLEVPLVELVLLTKSLHALDKLSDHHYDGILLSSPNLIPLLKAAGRSLPAAWLTKPWYLIGSRARQDVDSLGVSVAFVPREASLEGFLREIPAQSNLRLIHPCSTKTRLEPALFTTKGINVHNMALYDPRRPEGAAAALEETWPQARAALFASGSAVHHLLAVAPKLGRTLAHGDGPVPVSLGASTSRALRIHGVERIRQAVTADNAGFLATLQSNFPGNLP